MWQLSKLYFTLSAFPRHCITITSLSYRRSPWWCGSPNSRHHPTLCGIHREERHIRKYRGACSANQGGSHPTWYGSRRLEDPSSHLWGVCVCVCASFNTQCVYLVCLQSLNENEMDTLVILFGLVSHCTWLNKCNQRLKNILVILSFVGEKDSNAIKETKRCQVNLKKSQNYPRMQNMEPAFTRLSKKRFGNYFVINLKVFHTSCQIRNHGTTAQSFGLSSCLMA